MGLGPGRMDLMLFGWEKTAEEGLFIEEVSKAMQELQLSLNILSLIAETIDILISLWVWMKMLILCHGCTPCWRYPCLCHPWLE